MLAVTPREPQQHKVSVAEAAAWVLKRSASIASWCFVRAVCGVWVALQCLDPRVHVQSLRVRSVTAGRLTRNNNKVALFVLYSDGPPPPLTQSFIDAAGRSEFDLVIATNRAVDDATRNLLLDRCALLIERNNIGRDFGAYKDGIAIVQQRYPDIDRLLLANDSVFYLPPGLDDLLAELAGGDDIIGVSEVFEHHYHVASFLVSFGGRVLQSPAFRRFWRGYRPIGTRRWAILRGEGALTAALTAAGFTPRVLYRTDALRHRLERLTGALLLAETRLLPAKAQDRLFQTWRDRAARGIHTRAPARIAADIADAVHARNQMHCGGFLFRRHLGLPVIKRDLVYRQLYPLHQAVSNLDGLDAPLIGAIEADLRARPRPESFGVLRRMFHRHGAI